MVLVKRVPMQDLSCSKRTIIGRLGDKNHT
jgi:hypothetical protein